MPKRPAPVTPALTRKQTSRAKREARLQRWILIGTVVLALAAIGVLIYGVVDQQYLTPNRAIATVNDDKITIVQFQNRVKLDYFMQFRGIIPLSAYGLDEKSYAKLTLDQMVDELLIAQKAKEKGISVTDAEIDREFQLGFGYDAGTPAPTPTLRATDIPIAGSPTATSTLVYTLTPSPTSTLEPGVTPSATATPTVTATATPTLDPSLTPTATTAPTKTTTPTITLTSTPVTLDAYNQSVASFIKQASAATGLSEQQVKDMWRASIRNNLLHDKLFTALGISADSEKTMIHAAHILVATEDEAKQIAQRLKNGESFEKLAADLSVDKNTAYKGGDLGWFRNDQMVKAFADAALIVPIGQISDPVKSDFGWHLIKVYDRKQVPMTANEQEQQRQTKFQDLLTQWRTEGKVTTDQNWATYAPTLTQQSAP